MKKQTDLQLKMQHLDNRTEKYNLQLKDVDKLVEELLIGLELEPNDTNVKNMEDEVKLQLRKVYNYSNYLAKRIPDFTTIPTSMTEILLAPDTTLESVINFYQSILYLSSVKYENLDEFEIKNKSIFHHADLEKAVDIGKFLYELNYERTELETLRELFVDVTFKVQSAIKTFRICANFDDLNGDKLFVVMSKNVIQLYLNFFSKTYPTGENMPDDARIALMRFHKVLDELDYENLRNNFEL